MEKRTYIIGGALIAVLIIVMVFIAYAPDEVQLTAADDGSTVKLKTGQIVTVTLEANPTTGYTWAVAEPSDGQIVLRQVGELEFEPESDLIGAGGVQIIKFEVVNPGQTVLTLVYHRPWETDVAPLKTFAVYVVAR